MTVASEWVAGAAVSRQGNRLAFVQTVWRTNIWRVDLHGPGRTPGAPSRLIPSTRGESHPDYSPDGKKIAFDSSRSGHPEIWVCNSDGSNPVRLTSLKGPGVSAPRWSPDGKNVVFLVGAEPAAIYVISANGGPARRLDTGPLGGNWPFWSRDGLSIYFDSSNQVWKVPVAGGKPVQMTRDEGDLPRESPDGKFVYYMKGWPSRCSIWRMPAGGGDETKVLEPVHLGGHFAIVEQGIYYFAPEDERGHSDINFYDFLTGKIRKIMTIEKPVYEHIAISPDRRTILYTQIDETGSDLMLVENFR
jgi:dipeptidyl aminopeptidase/acylaminoacyl peptidase